MDEEDILHELKELYQWRLDRELLDKNESDYFSKLLPKFNVRSFLPEINKDISDFYSSQLQWQFAVPNKKRTLLAVLQDTFLEIRQKRDEYQKPIGRASIPVDKNPNWRKLTWSSDGILIAFSSSNGELTCYNTLANLVCAIPKVEGNVGSNSVIPEGAVVSLFLLETRTKNAEWPYELLALDFFGNLRSYFISSTEGYKPYHTFCFGECTLTAAVYVPLFNTLVIAFPIPSVHQKSPDDTLGLSSWRILNDYPYYRLVKPSIQHLRTSKKRSLWVSFLSVRRKRSVILQMAISSNSTYLACVHSCGTLTVWTFPQLKIHQTWRLQDICQRFHVDIKNPTSPAENMKEDFFTDICWCLDTKLAVLRVNGSLIVSGIDKFNNLLAQINANSHTVERQPEQLNVHAKLANFCDINTGFLMLDCKLRKFTSWRRESQVIEDYVELKADESTSCVVEVSENHSLMRQILRFFVHFEIFQQQKKKLYVEKTYSLITLQKVTPEELYDQKINDEEYDEALEFARLFNLDENRVYKKQWNSCRPITLDSIENYLLKITDKWWIIHQCCERIPETLTAAKALLNYGLQYTDFDSFLDCVENSVSQDAEFIVPIVDTHIFEFNSNERTTHFPKSQLHIIQLRKYLLLYWDALTVYQEIIELDSKNMSFNEERYKKFRTESPFTVALNFARDGIADAIVVLFKYYTEELSSFWLKILDNIPECIPPCNYKQILPKFNEENELEIWEHKRIREADWSESGEFKDLFKSKSHKEYSGEHFPFSKKLVAEWYERRIRKIIEKSGLIDNALELLNLANKNDITGLEHLRHNLLVLDTIMYELQFKKEISLSELETLSEFDKLMLLMSEMNSEDSFLNNISNILIPFLNRCEVLIPNIRDALLDDYLKHLSQYDLNLPLIFFMYVSEKHEDDFFISDKRILELGLLSVYACERVDQIDVAMKIIQHLPEFSDNNNLDYEEVFSLHSRLTDLQFELDIMQLLQSYGIERSLNYLHKNKTNAQFQKDILTSMVSTRVTTRMLSKQDVLVLLDDMKFIQENFFNSLPRQTYLRIFAFTMLTLGRNDCIEEYAPLVLRCSSSEKSSVQTRDGFLPFDESVIIITEAAQYYFNIASSCDDPSISLAESCLSLISFHPHAERERKLINALKELNAFGVRISPLKVRMSVNKMKIIEKVLKAKPKCYKKIEHLLSLAENLEFDSDDKKTLEFDVLNCAVNAAFQMKDYVWCSVIVTKLAENQKPCWNICKQLCECEEYHDFETKQKLIKLTLLDCPDKEIIDFVELRNEIERKVLQKRLQNSMLKLQSKSEDKRQTTSFRNENPGLKNTNETKMDGRELSELESFQGLISIPSFVNMLHTSSSNVLKVDFWKNTFKFSSKDDDNVTERNLNNECQKLGFPEFYGDLHQHCDCCCFLLKTPLEEDAKMLHLLLRYYLLSQNSSKDVSNAITTNIHDVIAQLSVRCFSNDCLFSFCLLMMLKNDQTTCEKVFNSLPDTIPVEKFALYYYSLKFLFSCNISVQDLVTEKSPAELVLMAQTTEISDSPYRSLIKKYKSMLEKRGKATKLEDLGCGIDSARFFSDDVYKADSILGLAMYEERDKLELALSLGAEYGVCPEDIILSHITSLFLTRNLGVLTERLKEPVVLETLKKRPKYAADRMMADIYDGLYGCDYQILLLYYALLNQISENDVFHSLKPKEHMKLLRKLKSFSKKIDYKLLTAEPPQVVEAFFSSVFSTEWTQAMHLLMSLPTSITETVNLQDVFQRLAQKTFFNGPVDLSHAKRFEICLTLFEKISETQITNTVRELLFSKYSCENVETSTRMNFLKKCIDFLSQKHSNSVELIDTLKEYSKKFSKIEELNEICRAADINEHYLRDLQGALVLSDSNQLNKIVLKMVFDSSVSTDEIKVILEFVHMGTLTDIITDLLNNEIDKSDSELILQRIENCIEENEYEKCWSSSLESLLADDKVSEGVRLEMVKIQSILQRSDEEIYSTIELLHETRLILREWISVHSRIRIFDIADENSRLHLLEQLSEQSTSFVQLTYLYKLLMFWPPFIPSTNWKNDPWQILLYKLISRNTADTANEEELKLVHKILVKRKLTKEARRTFFDHIGNTDHNKLLLVWFCVLTNDELLVQSVNGYITELRMKRIMPKMVEEYLKKRYSVES